MIPVYLQERTPACDYNNAYSGLMLFRHPLLVSMPRDHLSGDALSHVLLYRLQGYVTRPSSDDEDNDDEEDIERVRTSPSLETWLGQPPDPGPEQAGPTSGVARGSRAPVDSSPGPSHWPPENTTQHLFTLQTVNSNGTSGRSNFNEDTQAQP